MTLITEAFAYMYQITLSLLSFALYLSVDNVLVDLIDALQHSNEHLCTHLFRFEVTI